MNKRSRGLYVERLEAFFQANGVADANKKRAILFSACGAKAYLLLRSLVQPQKPTDVAFCQTITETAEAHFNPKPSPIEQRVRFNTRNRQPGQSVSAFVADLRRLAEHSEFHDLSEMLREASCRHKR